MQADHYSVKMDVARYVYGNLNVTGKFVPEKRPTSNCLIVPQACLSGVRFHVGFNS